MGHATVDLRQAEVVGDEVTITAIAFMGGVDVIVPEGIEVVMQGVPIMGANQTSIRDVPVIPGSPLIRVRGFPFMGGVTVRSRRPPGETKKVSQDERRRLREPSSAANATSDAATGIPIRTTLDRRSAASIEQGWCRSMRHRCSSAAASRRSPRTFATSGRSCGRRSRPRAR